MSHCVMFTCSPPVPPVVSTVQPLPVVVNTTVVLVCAVSGLDPPDRISWYFNSVVVFTGNATTGGDFTQFFTIDDYGAYTCSSSNEFGTTNSTIQVIQAGILYRLLSTAR